MQKEYDKIVSFLASMDWTMVIAAVVVITVLATLLAVFGRSCRADKLGFLRLQRWESSSEALQRVRYLKWRGFRRFTVPIDIARCTNQGEAVNAGELYLHNALSDGWQLLPPRIVGKQRRARWFFEYKRVAR